MTTKIIALLGASAFALNSFAQNSATDPVLFNYGNDAVNKSEFVRVYEKHNANDTVFTKIGWWVSKSLHQL